MDKKTILIIEDEPDIVELLSYNLSPEHTVLKSYNGQEGLHLALKERPNLIILDVMLPGKLGTQVCMELRCSPLTSSIPILMLTAKAGERDIIKGLDKGADDYLTKPFNINILKARVKALLRRSEGQESALDTLKFKDITLNMNTAEVNVNDMPIELTHAEFEALKLMMERPNWVFSREQLVKQIHGEDHIVSNRTIDVLVVNLRKKLGEAAVHLETVRGIGYKLKERL